MVSTNSVIVEEKVIQLLKLSSGNIERQRDSVWSHMTVSSHMVMVPGDVALRSDCTKVGVPEDDINRGVFQERRGSCSGSGRK